MRVLLDTSALVALMDADDPAHQAVSESWAEILAAPDAPLLASLTLVEVLAVLPRRLGMDAVAVFCERHLPLMELVEIDTSLLLSAVDTWLAARRRDLSLIDVVSFLLMRREGLRTAFALDRHFAEQGFECIPGRPTEPS